MMRMQNIVFSVLLICQEEFLSGISLTRTSGSVRGMKELLRVKRSWVFPTADPAKSDSCSSPTGAITEACVNISDCLDFDRRKKICGWNGANPMVCCDSEESRKTRRFENVECGKKYASGTEETNLPLVGTNQERNSHYGHRKRFPGHGVAGEKPAKPLSYPWMVALDKKTYGTNHRFLCGASLISRRHILTAAHCFQKGEDGSPEKFTVRLRAHLKNGGTRYVIQSITIHPDYNEKMNYNDIAILTLMRDVNITAKVSPICLPRAEFATVRNLTNKQAVVVGWGHNSFGGTDSKVLLEVSLPVVDTSQCNKNYSTVGNGRFPKGITDDLLCAGHKEGGKDACQNDSGGPLQIYMNDRWEQIGIVSFGYLCGEPGYPGVYTRVARYVPWIHEVISTPSDNLHPKR